MTTRARDPGPFAREIEHTADLGFEVEAPTPAALFERAALAVIGVMLDAAAVEPRERVRVVVEADGWEELLHDWLQGLLVRVQTDGFAPAEITVTEVAPERLVATLVGEHVDPARHRLYTELKGVTYHRLAVAPRDAGWWARVILDV